MANVPLKTLPLVHLLIVFGVPGPPGHLAVSLVEMELKPKLEPPLPKPKMVVLLALDLLLKLEPVLNHVALLLVK